MGRLLVVAGLALVAVGLLVMGLGRMGVMPGRLPGDLTFRSRFGTVFAPLGTSLLLSLLLTGILWLIGRWRR